MHHGIGSVVRIFLGLSWELHCQRQSKRVLEQWQPTWRLKHSLLQWVSALTKCIWVSSWERWWRCSQNPCRLFVSSPSFIVYIIYNSYIVYFIYVIYIVYIIYIIFVITRHNSPTRSVISCLPCTLTCGPSWTSQPQGKDIPVKYYKSFIYLVPRNTLNVCLGIGRNNWLGSEAVLQL